MKVLLREDVGKLGRKNEVVEVKNGYGLNYLLPQGLAQVATPEDEVQSEKLKQMRAEEMISYKENIAKAFEVVSGSTLTISEEANKQGGLYAAITPSRIAQEINLTNKTNLIETEMVTGDPIKEVGEHTVTLMYEDLQATFTLILEKK